MIKSYLKFRKKALDKKYTEEAEKIRQDEKSYVIIPLGTYCLPRVIMTVNKLKKTKGEGEKSFPFDLGFFDFNNSISQIKNHFEKFFDTIQYKDTYRSTEINAVFNHDANLTWEEFVTRYEKRINNFYEWLSNIYI